MSNLSEIKICTHYELDGQKIEYPPELNLERCVPVYKVLRGWKGEIGDVVEFEQLPKEAKEYVYEIEKIARLPVSIISVGPRREQTIIREDQHEW